VQDELDLRMEAAAASELADAMAVDPNFRVPRVDWQRTSRRVLTLERVAGIPINEVARIKEAGLDPKEVLAHSARAFFHQVFEHGFFHADMHPGNMFVGMDGTLLPVDFGIMGRLDRKTRFYLADMLFGFLNGDYGQVADVHLAAGYVPRDQSREAFMQACRAIGEPIKDLPLHDISVARLLAQLFEVTERFEMETQPQLLLLQKTMLVAEGVGRGLDPDTNMWVVAHPLIERWMIENRGPHARLRQMAEDAADFAASLPELARAARRASQAVTEDGLRLHPETVQALKRRQGGAGRWALAAAALAAGIAIGLLF
jgi:ubiquinone biosynthesis protein